MSNHLQNKLLHYEVSPPETVWNKIDSSLNEELRGMNKLYNFTQQPSSLVWEKLARKIDDDPSFANKLILFFNRYHKPLRYVSAAAIIAIVAITVTLFVNKDAVSDEVVYQPVSQPVMPDALKLNESLPENNTDTKTNDQNPTSIPDKVETNSSRSNSFTKNNRYLTVANQKGNTVRFSQKALRIFNCAENITAVNNSRCKENIQLLQQKMATSLVSPSGDFAGLIDMIKRLDDNL